MKIELNIKLKEFCVAQFAIVSLILVLGLASYLFSYFTGYTGLLGFLRLLDVDAEQSIPTYFSTINLLLSALLIFIIYRYEKANDLKGFKCWLFLSILFLLLSVDESASIHEKFSPVYQYLARAGIIPSLLEKNRWLPFGVLFVLLIGVGLLPFLKLLPKDTLRRFLISGAVFLMGTIGFELISSLLYSSGFDVSRENIVSLIRLILEEGCEMFGIALFNCALYREILKREIFLVISNS